MSSQNIAEQTSALSNLEKLEFYALFQQGTIGDVNSERPGILDMKGKAQWDAWKAKQGMSQEDAKAAYITKVKQLEETESNRTFLVSYQTPWNKL